MNGQPKKWKSLTFLFSFFCIILVGFLYSKPTIGPVSDKSAEIIPTSTRQLPVVVLLPHQDDEMFLAGSIIQYLEQGRDVYAVMVSDGGSSSARYMLNGRDEQGKPYCCGLNRKVHNPIKEGYQIFDRQHFSRARNYEFHDSMIRLGIPEENIFFANPGGLDGSSAPLYKDASLTKSQAREVIEFFYKKFGDGVYITVESRDGHAYHRNPDHSALQDALIEFPGISEKYYFSDQAGTGEVIQLSLNVLKIKQKALNIYYEWNPGKGKFAIGAHSVKYLLDEWTASKFEYRNK